MAGSDASRRPPSAGFAAPAAAQGFRPAAWPAVRETPFRVSEAFAVLRPRRSGLSGARSMLLTLGDGTLPPLDAHPRPGAQAWDHEPDWAALVLAAPGVDPRLGLVAGDLFSALALVTGQGRPLLVTTERRLGASRWLRDGGPIGHGTTSGLLSHAIRHLRGACEIPDLLAIRASWSLDLYDRYGVRSLAGIRLASGRRCYTLVLMADETRRALSPAQAAGLAALDRLARATMAQFDEVLPPSGEPQGPGVVETLTASKVAKAAAAVTADRDGAPPAPEGEALPAPDRREMGRQSIDAMVAALKLVRPRSREAAFQLASFTQLLRPCLPANWADVAETAALALPLGSLGTPAGAIEILEDGVEGGSGDPLQVLSAIPAVSAELVGRMPGLEDEKLLLECLADPFSLLQSVSRRGDEAQDLHLTASLVLLAVSFVCQIRLGHPSEEAVARLRARPPWASEQYAEPLAILSKLESHDLLPLLRKKLTVPGVRVGMVMAKDLVDGEGVLLLSRGTHMSGRHVDRLRGMESAKVGELEVLYDPEAV